MNIYEYIREILEKIEKLEYEVASLKNQLTPKKRYVKPILVIMKQLLDEGYEINSYGNWKNKDKHSGFNHLMFCYCDKEIGDDLVINDFTFREEWTELR